MPRKPFSKELYKENDEQAKKKTIELFEAFGWTLLDDEENYGKYDLKFEKDDKIRKVEAERKKVWTSSGEWEERFNGIDIPWRKKKSKADIFSLVNKHLNTLAVAKMSVIHDSPVIVKDTEYTTNERFFRLDTEYTRFFFLSGIENKWIEVDQLGNFMRYVES